MVVFDENTKTRVIQNSLNEVGFDTILHFEFMIDT